MNILEGKTIVITGASKGIGRALALKMAAQGVNLSLLARSASELEELKKAIGQNCEVFAGDIADEIFVNNAIASTIKKFGTIDIVVNNAGFGIFKQSEEFTAEEWDSVFATNMKGTFLVSRAAIPVMKQNKSGHIINIASDVARRVFPGGSLYCATKYAQDAYSMTIRKELRSFNIKVSVVYSGLVDSSFHPEGEGHDSHSWWLQNEDMANAIVFVASQPANVVIDELTIHPLAQEY